MTDKLNILVWNEGVHEARNQPETMAEMYPNGIHGAIADGLKGFYPDSEHHHGHAGRPGARTLRGDPGRDRRAAVVGPRGPR